MTDLEALVTGWLTGEAMKMSARTPEQWLDVRDVRVHLDDRGNYQSTITLTMGSGRRVNVRVVEIERAEDSTWDRPTYPIDGREAGQP